MSKRDMRAKKLLLAVLLAMSMQSYYAAPTWAAETGQPAGQTETVDGKGQSDGTTTPAADEAETVKKIDTKQEVDEALTIMGYSVNTLNADEDAGIMPAIVAPGGNPSTNAYTAGDASVSGSNLAVAIGYGANATSADGSVVLGASGEATAKNAVALGYNAKASHENSVAIGANSTTTAVDQVSFGKYDGLDEYNLPVWAVARSLVGIKDIDINGINFEGNIHDENVIIGGYMDVPSKYSTLVGYDSITNSDYGVAIGKRARVHTSAIYSVALGAESFVDEDYTVSFGNDDGMSRKLIGVNGIEFADNNGYLIGVTYINGVTVSDPYSFNDGLTFGGNATIGKANTPFSSNKFSVNDTGAITAASLSSTGAIIANSFTDGKATLTGGKLTGVTGINSTGAITTASLSSTGAITAASGTIGGITLNGGALDKVSSINGADFTINSGGIAVGYGTSVGEYGIAFGSSAHARGDGIALGRGVDADGPSSIALGFNMTASGAYSISIGGDDTYSDANKSIAIGTGAEIDSNPAGDENIGSIAFGFYANASHENSVAIGMGSNATDDNQVNLGYYKLKGNYPDTSSTYYGRSLAGISSIDFIAGEDGNKGVITGLSSINGVAVSGSAADGLTFGGNAIIGKTDIPFSSTGFSVDKVGALTASSGTIGGITLNGGALDKVTSINDANLDMNHGIGFGWEAYIYGSGAIAIGDEALSGDDSVGLAYGGTVAIGTASAARKNYSTAIGANTEAGEERGTALGYMAYADKVNSVAIGTASKTFNNNEVNFGYYTLDRGSTNESGPYYGRSLAGISSIDFIAGEDGTKGAITGVTSINGMNFVYDGDNSNIILGANVKKDVGNTIALGVGATASGPISMALGNNASATAQEATVIGADASVFGEESVGVGSNSTNSAGQTVVIGVSAGVYETAYTNSTVIGYSARSSAPNGIALGANAEVKHENSVAIGTESITTAVNQVSFGHKQDDLNAGGGYFGDDLFRSVVNVADIEMHGGITGLTSIEGVAVSGSADAGLTVSGVTLNGGAVNGVTLGLKGGDTDQDNVLVGGIDLTALSQSSGGNTGDITALKTKTEGIERTGDGSSTPYATTIEGVTLNSNKVTASGGIVVDSNNQLDAAGLKASKVNGATITSNTFNEVLLAKDADNSHYKVGDVDVTALSRTVGDATKGLVKDTADLKTAVGDADTGLAAVNTKVTDLQTATTGMSYDSGTTSTSFSGNVVVGNVGNQTHTQITDNAIIFGQGAEKQVTVDASGIHVGAKAMNGISTFADSNGTHIDHTSLVTDTVTAANLNGVAISGNATDGLSVGGVNIKTLDDRLATLKTTVDDIQNSGVGTADMAGVQRSDADGDGINDTTTIETATSFTANGMKTSNLEVLTAAIGGVDFAANGVMTNVGSINGISFADGKIGGVSLSGGKVNGVDVVWLDKRVTTLEKNGSTGGGTGGGGGANTSGITKPDGDNTVIEGNTNINSDGITTNKVTASDQIIVADGKDNQTVISEDGIKVAAGKTNEVTINDKGIHVGKNSSVMNDTEGFITDKGLYIGVNSSNDISTAKFSVDKGNGTMTSKVGGYTFTNGSSGAVFSHSGDTAVTPGGSFTETTIKGNKVTTGRLDADELYVDGNKVNIAGGTIGQTDAVANHLEGTDGDGNKVTNDFKTSALNGTTQAAEQTSADGKKIIKTENNTSAGGTSVTTSKTSINSADRKTEQSSSFVTNEGGMSLNTSTKVTDKDGNITKNTSGETKMSGDSLTVSKTTVTSKDGKEETTTSSTTVGSGEVTLHREDGSTIRVGEAIEGMQGQIQDIGSKVNKMGVEIKEVGALSAALAGLHPQPENANSRADFAMAMGSYEGKQALAVGGFYRPDKRTMLSIGASTTSSKHMMNMGISIALDRLPEEERKAQEAAAADPETLNKVLERLAALEQDNQRLQADNKKRDIAYEKLAADYTQLKEKYTEKTAEKQQSETKMEEAAPAEADSSSEE